MKRIDSGEHRIETPVGTVGAPVHRDRAVTVNNVASYRLASECGSASSRLRQTTRRGCLGRQLVFSGARQLPGTIAGEDQATDGLHRGNPQGIIAKRGLPKREIKRSTTSRCSGNPIRPRSTARTSCSVPGRPTIVPPAALGPAPSGQASMPMEKSAKDRFGSKRVLSGVGLKAALRRAAAKSTPASRRQPS